MRLGREKGQISFRLCHDQTGTVSENSNSVQGARMQVGGISFETGITTYQ